MVDEGRRPVFPYGLWERNPDSLLAEPISTIVAEWPGRAVLMLRGADIIHHFTPPINQSDGVTRKVLEIGSGPAMLAGLMMHVLGSRHVLVDLPEQAVVGFSFLSEFFPNKRVLLPNELAEAGALCDDADVVFITPEQLDWLNQKQFDIAINMFSFQEMSYSTINEYLELIRTHLKFEGIFYCVNRVSKFNGLDGTTSEFAKYPWSSSDKFLHNFTFDRYLGGIKVAGGAVRESVVRLAPHGKMLQE